MTETISKSITATDGWLPLVSTTGPVSVSFSDGNGEYAVHNVTPFPPGRAGQFLGRQPEHMLLPDGDTLFVRGEGRFVATGDNFLVVSD